MRRLGYVLLMGVFLLMLSALVVSSEEPAAAAGEPLPVNLHFIAAPPSAAQADLPADGTEQKKGVVCEETVQTLHTPPLLRAFDSNGRVLTAVRYENSVYQVFRPEVAGG